MADSLPILVRAFNRDDITEVNCVRKSWLRCFASSDVARAIGGGYWDKRSGYADVVNRLVRDANIRVACSVTHHRTIVGWACVESGVVHFVYVADMFRRQGVARKLLENVGDAVTYTHATDMCRRLPIPDGWKFNFCRAVVPTKDAA